jgi:pimeloyl-ACP methyl ester carboxylesterase
MGAPPPPLHVERRGSGRPLLLLHGLGGDWRVWSPVLDALAAAREVLAVDLPGFGASPALDGGSPPTPARLAAAVAAELDRQGLGSVDVAGNSLGGWVALELARLGRARSVAAIAPAGLWGHALGPRRGRGVRGLPRPLRALLPWLVCAGPLRRVALMAVVAHPERVPARAARRIVRAYLEAPGFAAVNAAMRAGFLRAADVGRLGVPVTIAWAAHDRLVAAPRGGVPGARVTVLDDAGHLAMWDQPAEVAALILETAR